VANTDGYFGLFTGVYAILQHLLRIQEQVGHFTDEEVR
jgi:hypothetical protein